MTTSTLDMFMGLKSINPNFVDAWGNPAQVTEENIRSIIDKMGFDSSDDAQLMSHYNEHEKRHWLSPLSPVIVCQKNSEYVIEVRLPIDLAAQEITCKFILEDKSESVHQICATNFPLVATKIISDIEYQCYSVTLAVDLPFGYHSLSLFEANIDEAMATMSFIVTPKSCYTPKAIEQGEKLWGTSVQLYCLKSEANWGIGDFSDLKLLLAKTKENGGEFIGLNPIHALSPSQPSNVSPYSPSSRKWLNILYTDITAVDEFTRNSALKTKVSSDDFKQKLTALRNTDWVNYEEVTALKLSALRDLFATLNDQSAESAVRLNAFTQYVDEKGESLIQQASYDALQFYFLEKDANSWGWPVWPEAFQAFQNEAAQTWIKENEAEVLFWCYTQWVAELQLEEADKVAKSLGMTLGIYRDLAVGVGVSSSEIWANHSLYCEHISVGAPPDILGPLGQSWGLPPLHPTNYRKLHINHLLIY